MIKRMLLIAWIFLGVDSMLQANNSGEKPVFPLGALIPQLKIEVILNGIEGAKDLKEALHFIASLSQTSKEFNNLVKKYEPNIIESLSKKVINPEEQAKDLFAFANNPPGSAIINLLIPALVDAKVNLDTQDATGNTALMIAAEKGASLFVRKLLEEGANPSFLNNQSKKASDLAKTEDIKKMLLNAEFIQAVFHKADNIQQLIDSGADVNAPDLSYGLTPLMWAAQEGYDEVVRRLLDAGAHVNEQNKEKQTALIFAADKSHSTVVEILLGAGADPNQQDIDGSTALMLAVDEGNIGIVEMLLNAGADQNLQSNNGSTPLMIAADKSNAEITRMILEKGVNPNQQDDEGHTALMSAAFDGNLEIVQMLLGKKADPNIEDKEGVTALILAAQEGHTEIIEMLLAKGVDVNKKDNEGMTALIVAAQEGHPEVVKMLLDAGADIDKQNECCKETALMLAADNGHTEVVQILLDAGARTDLINNDGKTAYQEAEKPEIKELIQETIEKRKQ